MYVHGGDCGGRKHFNWIQISYSTTILLGRPNQLTHFVSDSLHCFSPSLPKAKCRVECWKGTNIAQNVI